MEAWISVGSQNANTIDLLFGNETTRAANLSPAQVAEITGDNGEGVACLDAMTRKLVMPGSASFGRRNKGLMNQQNVHVYETFSAVVTRGSPSTESEKRNRTVEPASWMVTSCAVIF